MPILSCNLSLLYKSKFVIVYSRAALLLTVENWRWLCVFSTNVTNLQTKYTTQNLNYQIYHNQCQFFVVCRKILLFFIFVISILEISILYKIIAFHFSVSKYSIFTALFKSYNFPFSFLYSCSFSFRDFKSCLFLS